MPLYKNTFQPYFPDPNSPMPKNCAGQYCYPIADGDLPQQEWFQTPCSGNLVVDPDFEDITIGADMIINGSFTGSAAGWTLGTGWSYGSNAAQYNLSGATHDTLSQSGIGLSAGTIYRIEWDQAFGAGQVAVRIGAGVEASGSSPNGDTDTITVDILYNDTDDIIDFIPQDTPFNQFSIDNVTCKPLTFASWDVNNTWNLTGGMACKGAIGTNGKLINAVTDYITNGDLYVAEVTVSGYAGGAVRMYVDDGTGATQTNLQTGISANGTYKYYFTATQDGVIAFEPISTFLGCLSSIRVQRLRNDYPFQLINPAGDVLDISYLAEYIENRVLLTIDFSSLREDSLIDYGCGFTVFVFDACLVSGDNILTDGDFNNQTYDDWVRNMGAHQYNLTGTGIEFIMEPLEGSNLVSNGDFSGGTTGWTFGANWAVSGGGAQHTPGSTDPITQSITLGALPAFPQTLFTWYQITTSGATTGTITVNIGGTNGVAYAVNAVITDTMTLAVSGAQTLTITPSSNFDGTIDDIKVHQTLNGWNNFPQIAHVPTPELIPGNYNVDLTITSNIQDTVTGVITQLDYNNGIEFDFVAGAVSNTFNNYVPTLQRLRISGSFKHPTYGYYVLGRIAIDDVSVYAVEPFEASYTSECFDFQETHPGTTLITGWCDQDSLGSTYIDSYGQEYNDNLGFETTGYLLQMRVRCRGLNPVLRTDGNNAFFSSGSSAVKYAQMEKYWQFVTDYMSESALIALGGIIRCDHFTIGELGIEATEYLAEMEDLSPGWIQDGSFNLAPASINVRLKDGGMKFMRHT